MAAMSCSWDRLPFLQLDDKRHSFLTLKKFPFPVQWGLGYFFSSGLEDSFFVSSFLQDRKQHTTTKDLFIIFYLKVLRLLWQNKSKLNWHLRV
jgi:hypothetical protein